MNYFYKSILIALCIFISDASYAQYTTKKIRPKHQAYTDSLKAVKYDYTFPILGQGAYSRGFDIPYPAGLMANYIWMDQGISITNMQLGLMTDNQDIPLTSVDFIEFGETRNTSYAANFRPDLWIFPFLNVYGLFGYGSSKTEVNLASPVQMKSVVEQKITTAGFGVMTAFGIGPVWVSVDGNWTWTKPELLDKPVLVTVMGLRLGHTLTFNQKPDRNIAIWVGAMRANMSSETKGAVAMKDALPPETWDRRDEIVASYWYWYENEATLVQKKVADEVLTPIVDRLDAADGSSIIKYGMDKQVAEMWNGIFGAQFQLNKRWMFRSEAGLIGDRKSFLFSVNYRFLM